MVLPPPPVDVGEVEADRGRADDGVPRLRGRVWEIAVGENLGAAEAVEAEGFQGQSPVLWTLPPMGPTSCLRSSRHHPC